MGEGQGQQGWEEGGGETFQEELWWVEENLKIPNYNQLSPDNTVRTSLLCASSQFQNYSQAPPTVVLLLSPYLSSSLVRHFAPLISPCIPSVEVGS